MKNCIKITVRANISEEIVKRIKKCFINRLKKY